MKKLIIGIDCGASGAIAHYYQNKTTVVKMPVEFNKFLAYMKELQTITDDLIVFIEKVQLQPGDMSGGKAFNIQKMLKHYNGLINALQVLGIDYVEVHPKTWISYLALTKKEEEGIDYNLHRKYKANKKKYEKELAKSFAKIKQVRKNRYKLAAQNKFPLIKCTLWNCDALLVLFFGWKKLQLDPEYVKSNLQAQTNLL
jgi:hypothetical protein